MRRLAGPLWQMSLFASTHALTDFHVFEGAASVIKRRLTTDNSSMYYVKCCVQKFVNGAAVEPKQVVQRHKYGRPRNMQRRQAAGRLRRSVDLKTIEFRFRRVQTTRRHRPQRQLTSAHLTWQRCRWCNCDDGF
ncbi:hypothetical protein ACJJTC_017638 [Scirpophaga incertulas]